MSPLNKQRLLLSSFVFLLLSCFVFGVVVGLFFVGFFVCVCVCVCVCVWFLFVCFKLFTCTCQLCTQLAVFVSIPLLEFKGAPTAK